MNDLSGKTAVVTAAASGIGRALSTALGAAGMHLALLDIDEPSLTPVADGIRRSGVRVWTFPIDVADRDSVRRAAAAVERDVGDVDLLCSNAGVIFTGAPLHETPDAMYDWMFAVNPGGTFNVVKAFVPLIRRHGRGGHVTITSSTAGLHVIWGHPFGAYCASKMAVVGLGEDLREALASENIGVSVICPGQVKSNAANSGRRRQERFGGPFDRENPPSNATAMEAPDAARIIERGIRDGAAYIFTQPADRALVQRRFEAIMADYDRCERVVAELGISPNPTMSR